MAFNKPVKTLRITDKTAIKLINDLAIQQRRSASQTAAFVICEHLGEPVFQTLNDNPTGAANQREKRG